MSHCLHVDLAGPFPQSEDCYTYFMVGVLRLRHFPLIFQIELLETQGAPEVAQALSRERRVRRIHTDRARELTSSFLETFLTRYPQVLHTHTRGYDPQANGTAERGVGMMKTLVLRSLNHSKLTGEFWSFAALYAAQSLLCKALQRKQRSPPFGSTDHLFSSQPSVLTTNPAETGTHCLFAPSSKARLFALRSKRFRPILRSRSLKWVKSSAIA
eukprot:5174721-Amphidinium_carterae.1